MKQFFPTLLLGILFLTLQTTFFVSPTIYWVRPDLLLILTLSLALLYPPLSGGIIVFFLGYLMDLFSGNGFGLYTFSRPLLFFVAQLFKDHIYLESFLLRSSFVFLFGLAEGIVLLLILKALNPEPLGNLYPLFFIRFLPQVFCTALLSPLFFSLFRKGYFLLYVHPKRGLGDRS